MFVLPQYPPGWQRVAKALFPYRIESTAIRDRPGAMMFAREDAIRGR